VRQRARLVLAGDGDVEGVRRQAQAGGDRVIVPGWLETSERNRLLEQSDVFALVSRAEGVPMALLEAMANGIPSITTPVGGIPDVFHHDVHGVLVKPGDVDEIRAGLVRLITDDAFRQSAGRAARESVRQYDVHTYARRLADIYQRIAPVAEVREIA
jgi:glycosyltransferase involved in cell wall biosynthesis